MICHGSGYLKINNSTNIIVVIFINYLMDTQLKITVVNYDTQLKMLIPNSPKKWWVFTQCTQILIWSYGYMTLFFTLDVLVI